MLGREELEGKGEGVTGLEPEKLHGQRESQRGRFGPGCTQVLGEQVPNSVLLQAALGNRPGPLPAQSRRNKRRVRPSPG